MLWIILMILPVLIIAYALIFRKALEEELGVEYANGLLKGRNK